MSRRVFLSFVEEDLDLIRLHSSFQDFPPSIFSFDEYEVVNWNIKQIVSALEKAAKKVGY